MRGGEGSYSTEIILTGPLFTRRFHFLESATPKYLLVLNEAIKVYSQAQSDLVTSLAGCHSLVAFERTSLFPVGPGASP